VSQDVAEQLVRWLDPAHHHQVSRLLRSGQRSAQEAVGLRHLSSHDDWRRD
jgi:hypothetical protein